MAHNLNIVKGNVSFMSVKEKAWHGIGTILDKPATAKEAIEAARLDYEVGLAQVYADLSTEKFNMMGEEVTEQKEIKGRFATYRTDTKDVFGIVGSKYTVVQNKEAFSFFDAIVGEGKAIYETAGALGKGETVFITAKLPSYIRIGNSDDIIDKYLLLTMSHDGSGAIQAMFTPVRVVCNNTLNAALKQSGNRVYIKHTASVHDNLAIAYQSLNIVNKLSEELQVVLTQMSKTIITETVAHNYFDHIFLTGEELKGLSAGANRDELLSTRKSNIIDDVRNVYHSSKLGQDLITCRDTVFGAYNAVTGYYNNVKDYKDSSDRMKNLTLGTAYNTGQKAYELANQLVFN